MKNVGNNSRRRSQGVPKIFRAPMYRAHCAVIFAIAQLSCFYHATLCCTVLVIVILSPSVCLSVTLVDCVHMVRPTIMISSPYGIPIILVSGDINQ